MKYFEAASNVNRIVLMLLYLMTHATTDVVKIHQNKSNITIHEYIPLCYNVV